MTASQEVNSAAGRSRKPRATSAASPKAAQYSGGNLRGRGRRKYGASRPHSTAGSTVSEAVTSPPDAAGGACWRKSGSNIIVSAARSLGGQLRGDAQPARLGADRVGAGRHRLVIHAEQLLLVEHHRLAA